MTDKELKFLFDCIKDFDEFIMKVEKRQDIILTEQLSIIFHDNLQPSIIDVIINHQKYSFDNLAFANIIRDIFTEKDILEKEEKFRKERVTEFQLRHEIFHTTDNIYKVHDEYIKDMFFASDIGSAHDVYLKKLQELLALFNHDNILLINGHRITSRKELKDYLKLVGFNSIDKDAS